NTPHSLRQSRVVNINDLRCMALRRLPKVVFDYLDGGAEGEATLQENCRAFAAVRAAGAAGTGYILSTISGHRLEDVKAGSSGPVCYQLYLLGGRGAAEG